MSTTLESNGKSTNGAGSPGFSGGRSPDSAAGSSARMAAISAVTNYKSMAPPLSFSDESTQDLYASNVFSKAVMKKRLPKPIFKSLMKTIEVGEKLDPTVADV
ncbi:MAG: glutamine synthetase III, partial [Pirellulales bacterium]